MEEDELIEGSLMDINGDESDLLEELDQSSLIYGVNGEHFDKNGDKSGREEKTDETLNFFDNSFLNSTEKSAKLNNSTVQSRQTRNSARPNEPTKNSVQKLTQLKISTSFSLNSKKVEKNLKEAKTEKPKPVENSVRYECCECKLSFIGNTELWDHLIPIHFNKMENNVKKS